MTTGRTTEHGHWVHTATRLAGALAGAVGVLTGCARERAARGPEVPAPPIVSRAPTAGGSPRLDWVVRPSGRTVVPVDPSLLDRLTTDRLHLADGRIVLVRPAVLRVEREPAAGAPDPTSIAARMGWWLGLSAGGRGQMWRSAPVRTTGEVGDGAAVLVLEPEAGVAGHHLSETTGDLGGLRVTIRWVEDVGASEALAGVFSRPLTEEAIESAWVRAALVMAERSPLTRWRARLARGELLTPPVAGTFDDPVVEALATGIEGQWAAALGTVAREDPTAARRVVERLSATIDFGGGVLVPAWAQDAGELESLLNALLAPREGGGATAAETATAWLESLPPVLCWVIDDAGATSAGTGEPEGTIGVANLTATPHAAWAMTGMAGRAGVAGAAPGAEIVAVSPHSVRRLLSGAVAEAGGPAPTRLAVDAALRGDRIDVRIGELVRTPTLYSRRVDALAPGVRIGPLHADWRLGEWRLAGAGVGDASLRGPWPAAAPPGEAGWATTGLVYRGVDSPLERGASLPDRWLLYLEAGEDRAFLADAASDRYVRVWFGPFGRSRVVLKITPDGRVIDESPALAGEQRAGDIPRLVRVVETARGWACWVPIPLSAVEPGDTLRLGVERLDARGVRTSWPRPSLPWQQEPSRIAIGTGAWTAR